MKKHEQKPPRIAVWFFDKIARSDEMRTINGDLEEVFSEIVGKHGLHRARAWYWNQVLKCFPTMVADSLGALSSLCANYAKVYIRFFRKHKIYASINIVGLAFGISACLMIFLFIADELSFDRFHRNKESLYRVIRESYNHSNGELESRSPFLPPPIGPHMMEQIEEIDLYSRHMWVRGVVRYEDRLFTEMVQLVDEAFFQMFSFSLISGDPEEVLSDGNSVVLTESMARKYCGSINPIGQTITITFGQIDKDFLVTGVSSKSPGNSSIQFDMLIHISNLPIATNDPPVLNNWRMWYFPLYVQLSDDAEIDHVEEKLDVFCAQFFEPVIQRQRDSGSWLRDGLPFTFRLQRIQDVYLDTRGLTPSIILSAIALIILTIAWVNFMNISVGLSSTRSKEVGVRKVAGAHRKQLMVQFWTEAVLTSLIGVVVGFLLTSVFLPKFNLLSGKQLLFSSFFQASHITALLLLIFISGLVAGSYPALVMSNFRPIDMLKHRLRIGGKTGYTRIMVVIQFSLTAVLIISSVVLGNQARFLIRKDLGYDEQGLVVVMTQENEQEASERLYARYRNRIILNSRVKSVTACTREFGLFLPGTSLEVDGRNIHYHYTRVDPHFVSTMGLKIVQGRDFEPEFQTDMNTVLVNERFIRELGSEFEVESFLDPSGQDFPNSCRVVGVIEDVHFLSLRSEIEPLLLYTGKGFSPARDRFSLIVLRIETDQILETREFLARAWKEIQPEKPFELVFLDESLENQYTREKRWSTIVMSSSALSILIACLGILGLTALIITRRTKEIGIRKVFGAKSLQIVLMIVSEFCALVGLANLIAWPVAFVTMQTVLSNYPYRTGLSIWVFLITGLGTVLLAILTIGYLAMKAALSNPVQTLRYE